MRQAESKISIFLGTFFFVSFLMSCSIGLWWQHMYSVGMSIDFIKVVPLALLLTTLISSLLTWMTWKVTKGKF